MDKNRRWLGDFFAEFSELRGKTLTKIDNTGDELRFHANDGSEYRMYYEQDCCASCDIEDICGDLQDLIGVPILLSEESCSGEPSAEIKAEREAARAKEKAECEAQGSRYYDWAVESETWTFYKLSTIKGSVTIRWYGSSNGYYSETATFYQTKLGINDAEIK